jgi:DNA-binding NarL/FixJ family response regulator
MALRVVFAEDNYLVRAGTAALLADVEEIELVQLVDNPRSLLDAVVDLSPDAVLTDIRMPPTFTNEGITAAKRIRAEHPKTGVVVLSQYIAEDYAYELLKDGVAGLGYLLKERVSEIDVLVRALHEVARGGSVLDPTVVERLLARNAREAQSPLLGLTEREREVLQEMATGRTNAAIARTLFMSERAVEKHIRVVFQKLGLTEEGEVNRRVAAVLAFLKAGGSPRPFPVTDQWPAAIAHASTSRSGPKTDLGT